MSFFDKPKLRVGYGFASDLIRLIPDDGCLLVFNAGRGLETSLRKKCTVERSPCKEQSFYVRDGYSQTNLVCDLYATKRTRHE